MYAKQDSLSEMKRDSWNDATSASTSPGISRVSRRLGAAPRDGNVIVVDGARRSAKPARTRRAIPGGSARPAPWPHQLSCKVVLPHGWLNDRDSEAVPEDAEHDDSGG